MNVSARCASKLISSDLQFHKALCRRALIFINALVSILARASSAVQENDSVCGRRRNTVYFGHDEHVELGRARVREWHNYCPSWLHRLPSRRAPAQRVGGRRRSPPLVSWARAATVSLTSSLLTLACAQRGIEDFSRTVSCDRSRVEMHNITRKPLKLVNQKSFTLHLR